MTASAAAPAVAAANYLQRQRRGLRWQPPPRLSRTVPRRRRYPISPWLSIGHFYLPSNLAIAIHPLDELRRLGGYHPSCRYWCRTFSRLRVWRSSWRRASRCCRDLWLPEIRRRRRRRRERRHERIAWAWEKGELAMSITLMARLLLRTVMMERMSCQYMPARGECHTHQHHHRHHLYNQLYDN